MAARRPIREKRLQQVREWRASGLTRDEFAARVGLKPKTLAWWAWKLESEGESVPGVQDAPGELEPEPELKFVEVEPVSTSTDSTTDLALELNDITVRIPAHFQSATLERVLDVLEARR